MNIANSATATNDDTRKAARANSVSVASGVRRLGLLASASIDSCHCGLNVGGLGRDDLAAVYFGAASPIVRSASFCCSVLSG